MPNRLEHTTGFAPVLQDGQILYLSGQGPEDDAGNVLFEGRIGAELSLEDGYAAARATGIHIARILNGYLGDLDRVDQVIKVLGFVASAPGFYEQPAVLHGFSDLMVELFGAKGRHARSAIGVGSLPRNQAVEIEMIVRVR